MQSLMEQILEQIKGTTHFSFTDNVIPSWNDLLKSVITIKKKIHGVWIQIEIRLIFYEICSGKVLQVPGNWIFGGFIMM